MPNFGTYGLDDQGGGMATAQNEPVSVPGMGGGPMGFGGDMQEFMKNAIMEQYQRKKAEQDDANRRRAEAEQEAKRQQTLAEIREREERKLMMEERNTANRNAQIDRMDQQGQMNAQRARLGGGREAAPDVGGLGALSRSVAADEMQSAFSGPKLRYVTGGPGILSGLTMDTMNMNAAQRKMYMPEGSNDVMPTAGPGGKSATMKDYDSQQAENAERRPDLHGSSYFQQREAAEAAAKRQEEAERRQQGQRR